ncbi:MAG TPA: CheR family methyltransferase [Flavobacterium sp.]|jgi:two-component system CheB/CheR fusion protein
MPTAKKASPAHQIQDFPIVGIGASAGGLDAFQKLLKAIDEKSGMAFVLVQHLSPDHDSHLPEILKRWTTIPVHEITDDINLAPDNIYIIPQNKILTADDGVLKLAPRDLADKKNRPIDVFFKSLAEVHKSFALGVVLSGSGFDGTEGLKAIREYGGVTYAQTPETAAYDSMPLNAISAEAADFVLAAEDIPQHLVHMQSAYRLNHAYPDDLELDRGDEDVFKQILRVLKLRTGNDFAHYKQPTLRRRIARRMVATNHEEPELYLKFLRVNKEEQDLLFNDVLIPVSYFFRDSDTFNILPEKVFPLLLEQRSAETNLRIWIAGCSTGEEAYSLAIALHEFLSINSPGTKVQLFASDISEKNVSRARLAKYRKEEVQNISDERLNKYFVKAEGGYVVSKAIRDMCVFAVHNFLKDPPFAKMDMISCRNVLIYFDSLLQKKAMTTFHYSLKERGVLFLGKSESTNSVSNLFDPLVKNHKLYVRKSAPAHFPASAFEPQEVGTAQFKTFSLPKKDITNVDLHKVANNILFAKYTPAGVIINEKQEIIHFHGDTSPFLILSPGKPNLNLLKMAREGLSFELRNALTKEKTAEVVQKTGIPIKGKSYAVDFDIVALPAGVEQHHLVVFKKHELPIEFDYAEGRSSADEHTIQMLEAELEQLRDDIRNVTEDQEAAHEELQSANEELLSSSEELQSLNEELETSAEELQSNNEELVTINDELMDRQDQLMAARLQAEAIVETVREALVIIDSKWRIRNANSSFYKLFGVTPEYAEGRSFFDLADGQFSDSDLRTMLKKILPEKTKIDDYELHVSLPKKGERILSINARQIVHNNYQEQSILVAVDDITDSKSTKILRESEERFRSIANTAPVLLWMSDSQGMVTFVNKGWLDFTGKTLEEESGLGWTKGVHPDDLAQAVEIFSTNFEARSEFTMEYRLRRYDGQFRWISVRGLPRIGVDGNFVGFVGGCMDIHEQKNFAAALEEKVEQRTKELRESESFLQSILNTTQNLIYVYDFEKEKVVFINKKAFEATGYTAEEIQKSKTDLFTQMIHSEDLAAVRKQRRDMRESSDGSMATIEFRLRNKKNEWTCQLARELVFKRDEKGNAIHYIGVATDISDIKAATEELLKKNQELEHSNAELASFSSIASHDLKEPLRKIQIFSKLVLAQDKDNVSDDSRDFLGRVIVSAFRMQQLIDDLISYSRTSSQKIVYIESDLNMLLNEVLEDLKEVIAESKALIDIPEMPFIQVIPSQFRQLFLNLISNAIKYHRANVTPHITITSEHAPAEEVEALGGDPAISHLKITVSDNGIGFAPEYKDRIFEPFQRLHGKDEYSGTGIGLAICKKIMVNHKGFIVADSVEGKGSSFYIYVPDGR